MQISISYRVNFYFLTIIFDTPRVLTIYTPCSYNSQICVFLRFRRELSKHKKGERFLFPLSLIYCTFLVDFLVGFVSSHFANSVFKDNILLEEVVNGYFTFSVVVHWTLEEEAEEALSAPTTCTSS